MGMVVRTNTMALNAYRQLGMNNNAVTKSLEKLSSGFRINRAGDDAAGLAISEKMKAQITGLETASANAQDGISLIQTAEGNLSEVHDMLNRMVELASKSANGTYTATERQALQDEVDQLLDEIDRISQSANFNGTKLLDGSLDGKGTQLVSIANEGEFDDYGNRMQGATGSDGPQLHKDPTTAGGKTHFEFDFNERSVTLNEDGKATFGFSVIRQNDMEGALFKQVTIDLGTGSAGKVLSGDELAKEVARAIADKDGAGNPTSTVTLNFTKDMAEVDAADKQFGGMKEVTADGTDVKITYDVTVKNGRLVFDMDDAGYEKAVAAAGTKMNATAPFQGNFVIGMHKGEEGLGIIQGTSNCASSNITIGSANPGRQLAETIVTLEPHLQANGKVNDGAGIIIGDEKYVFAASKDTLNAKYDSNTKVIDITDLVETKDGELVFKDVDTLQKELGGDIEAVTRVISRLTEAASGNKMWDVQQGYAPGDMILTERLDNTSSADLTTEQGIRDTIHKFNAKLEKVGGNGSALTLQIGDTADSYNKMSVNVADMSTEGLGLSKLSIMSEPDASKAIDTIKAAINTVSTARAGMGALQNRLEHTINNLDVAVENLSAANSRIRDTDMAKEMMNYTKMNVLVQSAQAMLAQANQQPQSVLQLLQ